MNRLNVAPINIGSSEISLSLCANILTLGFSKNKKILLSFKIFSNGISYSYSNTYTILTFRESSLLKALQKSGRLDIELRAGREEQLPVRLVALPVPEAVAAERRRKANTSRDRRLNLSKEHLALLGWEIFITNIPSERLTAGQIADLYDLRWRIEIVFKTWKSHFHLTNVPEASAVRVKSHIYAMLIFITLFQTEVYQRLSCDQGHSAQQDDRPLSMLKLAQFFTEQLWAIVSQPSETVLKHMRYHCVYERRTDRRNQVQKMSLLG